MKRLFAAALVAGGALAQTASIAEAAPVQWLSADGGNNHYYEVITDFGSWDDANAIAQSSTHMGQQGYLATMTSLEEVAFIESLIQPYGTNNLDNRGFFLGGSDAAVEGQWQWVTGPEAGTNFFFNNNDYPWVSYQPDNFLTGQDYVIALIAGADVLGGTTIGNMYLDDVSNLNDFAATIINGQPVVGAGAIIEYGGLPPVPIPAAAWLLLSALGGLGLMGWRGKRVAAPV